MHATQHTMHSTYLFICTHLHCTRCSLHRPFKKHRLWWDYSGQSDYVKNTPEKQDHLLWQDSNYDVRVQQGNTVRLTKLLIILWIKTLMSHLIHVFLSFLSSVRLSPNTNSFILWKRAKWKVTDMGLENPGGSKRSHNVSLNITWSQIWTVSSQILTFDSLKGSSSHASVKINK